jgi:hypothetical protein
MLTLHDSWLHPGAKQAERVSGRIVIKLPARGGGGDPARAAGAPPESLFNLPEEVSIREPKHPAPSRPQCGFGSVNKTCFFSSRSIGAAL